MTAVTADGDSGKMYRCLCNTHVETGAKVIAIIFIIMHCFIAGFFLTQAINKEGQVSDNIAQIVIGIVTVFLLILVLLAQKFRKPYLYLPYIVLAVIQLLLSLPFTVMMIFGFVAVEVQPEAVKGLKVSVLISAVVFILLWILFIYCLRVIWSAYKYMKWQLNTSNAESQPSKA